MKIKVELYGASKDFSPENTIDLDLKSNSRIKKNSRAYNAHNYSKNSNFLLRDWKNNF